MKPLNLNVRKTIHPIINRYVIRLNSMFNNQTLRTRKYLAGAIGILIASTCIGIIIHAVVVSDISPFSKDIISQPKSLPMLPNKPAEMLIPIGKMKGEIDGEFDAFYVARDDGGTIYINRDWDYEKMFEKSPAWKPVTSKEFEEYKKNLFLLPLGNGRNKQKQTKIR